MPLPSRKATDQYLFEHGGVIDIAFDIDLGELVPGHHVIARGIELDHRGFKQGPGKPRFIQTNDSVLHYEYVPGRTWDPPPTRWRFEVADDIGTQYSKESGGADSYDGGAATHGFHSIDLHRIPNNASILTLTFHPSSGWTPPEPWRRKLIVDLHRGVVIG